MHKHSRTKAPAQQRGVGLIEVMVAVLVLAVGMLGVAAMQAMALRNNQSASERSAAVTASYAILDALRADRDRAVIGAYNITEWACELPDSGNFVNNELRNWIDHTQQALGSSACVKLDCDSDSCSVRIRWDDRDDRSSTAGVTTQKIETVSQI